MRNVFDEVWIDWPLSDMPVLGQTLDAGQLGTVTVLAAELRFVDVASPTGVIRINAKPKVMIGFYNQR